MFFEKYLSSVERLGGTFRSENCVVKLLAIRNSLDTIIITE